MHFYVRILEQRCPVVRTYNYRYCEHQHFNAYEISIFPFKKHTKHKQYCMNCISMVDLPQHLIHKIVSHVESEDIMKVFYCNKKLQRTLCDEHFWKTYCYTHWSVQFWKEAQQRDMTRCQPYISYYYELRRLIYFEQHWKKLMGHKPTMDEYRIVWKFV